MPHAFSANPNHPAVSITLFGCTPIWAGKILENRKEAKRLADAMMHVEAVIRLFDPAYQAGRIAARRRYKGNGVFKRGTILRSALDVLRKAQGPLTARETNGADAWRSEACPRLAPKAMRSLIASVQTSLRKSRRKERSSVSERECRVAGL